MVRKFCGMICCALLALISAAQQKQISPFQNKFIDYKELQDSKPVDITSWNQLPGNVTIAFGDVNTRYQKHVGPNNNELQQTYNITGWKGEKLHMQVLVATKKMLTKVSFKAGEL
ncbi:MAG: hypothetical protein ABI921_12605, partial [Panacibacter sp.]